MKTNQLYRPVGFNASWQSQDTESNHDFSFTPPQQNNLYIIAVAKAMKEFLIEEAQCNSYSELRLVKKIEAARLLFDDDKKMLKFILR